MRSQKSIREILARMFPTENTGRWNLSFDDHGVSFCRGDHEKNHDCEWEEVGEHTLAAINDLLVIEELETKHGVHMSHCDIGDYEGSCKYGEDNCPALRDKTSSEPILGGGLTPEEWLRSMAASDVKKGATARAREAEAIATWIEQLRKS